MPATLKINLCMSCLSYFLVVYLFEVGENASKQNVSWKISVSTISKKKKKDILFFFKPFFYSILFFPAVGGTCAIQGKLMDLTIVKNIFKKPWDSRGALWRSPA